MMIQKRKITANEELPEDIGAEVVDVAPEATDLLFEAEDVAELVAEVTGNAVEVEVAGDGNSVVFTVGDSEYTVEAEGNEEVLESVRKNIRGKRPVTSSRQVTKPAGRVIKKLPSKR